MSSDEKKDEDAKKEGFFKKLFSTPSKSSSTDKPKKHGNKTAFRKTPKHAGDDDQKQHTHDGNPDMEQGEKDPKTDQVLRDESGDCK
ncbi:hypothetical protein ECG_01646 [Echinococcus granulosus]|uniref:Expressed conserved protein n=1 Tax=Echinococcus granulosus TaxID=6210 RepID=A0A068WAJ1_ECHGR|nr:hypothetical protein ECG_01646 [Echinococcus granulosus]CDS15414.1 expressed conserved protein [Echinococcus granulosus]